MSTHLHILFLRLHAKENKEGLAPVIVRLTCQKQRKQMATGYSVSQSDWQLIEAGTKIRNQALLVIADGLEGQKVKLRKLANALELEGRLTVDALIDAFQDTNAPEITLRHLITLHNEDLQSRIGKDRTKSTYDKYRFLEDKIKRFLQVKFKRPDVLLSKLDKAFINRFAQFLLQEDGNQHNTIAKYCKNLKHVLSFGVEHGYLKEHPFAAFRIGYKNVDRSYLTASELETLKSKVFANKRLELIRDLFVFQCYTGLAYVDMVNLTRKNIIEGVDGKPWLVTHRQKTKTKSIIPLLEPALQVIDRYRDHPLLTAGKLLPGYAIQKFNTYLKELALICNMDKNLTSHAGRRTFATTVALGNGVSMESISKMLGHTNARMTAMYAIVTDLKLSEEMQRLSLKLGDHISE